MREHAEQRETDAPATVPGHRGAGAADRILALQRSAGNRAVSAMLARADAGTATAPPTAPTIKKTVKIYAVSLGSSVRDPEVDIVRANTIWNQCGVKIESAGGESNMSDLLDLQDPKNVLNEYDD